MAALDFPNSPALNEQYTANGRIYRWNGTSWIAVNSGYVGSQGAIGYTGSQGIQGVIGYTGSAGTGSGSGGAETFNPFLLAGM